MNLLEIKASLNFYSDYFKYSKNNPDNKKDMNSWLKDFKPKVNIEIKKVKVVREYDDYYKVLLDEDEDDFTEIVYKKFDEDNISLNQIVWPEYKQNEMFGMVYVEEGQEVLGKTILFDKFLEWIEKMETTVSKMKEAVLNIEVK
ncbi:hypothetical protein D3C81_958490 [compost metagenome]